MTRFELSCVLLILAGAAAMLNIACGVPGVDQIGMALSFVLSSFVTLGGLLVLALKETV
jgi:hypothetical protein